MNVVVDMVISHFRYLCHVKHPIGRTFPSSSGLRPSAGPDDIRVLKYSKCSSAFHVAPIVSMTHPERQSNPLTAIGTKRIHLYTNQNTRQKFEINTLIDRNGLKTTIK
jgi:hypothetical protein